MVELAICGHFDVVQEFFLQLGIEYGVFAKPDVHAPVDLRRRQLLLLEPEGQDRVDASDIFVSYRGIYAFAEEFDGHK